MKGDGAGQEEHSFLTTNAWSRSGSIRRGRPLAARGRQRCSCRRCCDIPAHHHGWRGMRCPQTGSLSPRCSGWRACVQAAGSPCPVATRVTRVIPAGMQEGKGSALLQGELCNSCGAHVPLPSEDGDNCGRFSFQLKWGFTAPSSPCRWTQSFRAGLLSTTLLLIPLSVPASALTHCLINLSVLPQISKLLSKPGLSELLSKPLIIIKNPLLHLRLTKPILGMS